MSIQEIPWKTGEGKIQVSVNDTNNWKKKNLTITSTTNNGFGRSQEITVKLSRSPSITKKFLVYQAGNLSYDGAIANTPNSDYKRVIDCKKANNSFGESETDKIYDGGNAAT